MALRLTRNGAIDHATRIGRLPFSASESTVNAPSAPGNVDCVGNGHAAWFKFLSPVATAIDADTLGSDYDTTLSAWTGPPTSLTQLACNDDGNALGRASESSSTCRRAKRCT